MLSITNWLKVHTDMPHHPQTLNLSRQMGLTRREAVGLLIVLWIWALTAGEAASKSSSDPDDSEKDRAKGEGVTRTTVSCNGDVTRTTALRHAVRQEETRQEKDVVSDETTTGGGSLPPSLSETEKFCRQKGGTEAQAAAFFAQYSAADWRANGAPIASWQGLLANFLRQGGQFHPSCASSPPKKPGEKPGEKLYVPENAKKNAAWMMRVLAESGDLP